MDVRRGWMLGVLLLAGGCAPVAAADGCCVACEDGTSVEEEVDEPVDEGEDDGEEEEGFDEELDRCDAADPGWCMRPWQARAAGVLTLEHSFDGTVKARVAFSGHRTCLDGDLPFWAGAGVQDGFVDPGLGDEGLVLEPGESIYLDPQTDWWCVEDEESTREGVALESFGERVPERLAELVAPHADLDADGAPDREQRLGDGNSQAQHGVWDAVATEALLTVGKIAETEAGRVRVTLTTRNLGRVAGDWTVEDRVPPGWRLDAVRPAPVEQLGSVESGWMLRWEGRSGSRGAEELSYTLTRASGLDRVYVELPEAVLMGPEQETTSSPAAVYHLDSDQDGEIDCR